MASKYRRQIEETSDQAENGVELPEVTAKQPACTNCFGGGFKVLVIGCIIFCVAITIGLIVDIYYLRNSANRFAVVTTAPECSNIATDILLDGGNAVDATVAAMMCLTVVRPDQSSLASGGNMLIYKNDKDISLDFQFATPKLVLGKQNANLVAIPGLLSGLQAAHKKYGSLPFSKLVEPSINLAYNGFVVSNSTALHIKTLPSDMKRKFTVNGKLVKAGETLKSESLRKTLTQIGKGNYSLAEDIVKTVTARSGGLSIDDFNQYKPLWKKPLVKNYKGYKVVTSALPSSGVLLLLALNIFNEFPKMNTSMSYLAAAEVLRSILLEQQGVRSLVQNRPDTFQANITETELSDERAKRAAKILINQMYMTVTKQSRTQRNTPAQKSSAAVSIIDADGNAVAAISSLGGIFGSKIMTDSGIILNDGLSMFPNSDKVNTTAWQKRPLSDASPAFISNKKMVSALSPCADEQGLAAVFQVLKDIIFDGSTVASSVNGPRVFFEPVTGVLRVEDKRFSEITPKDVVTLLKSRFSTVVPSESIGSVNVAIKSDDTFTVVNR